MFVILFPSCRSSWPRLFNNFHNSLREQTGNVSDNSFAANWLVWLVVPAVEVIANNAGSEELAANRLLHLFHPLLRPVFTALSSAMVVISSPWWAFDTSALFALISIFAQAAKLKICILLSILS